PPRGEGLRGGGEERKRPTDRTDGEDAGAPGAARARIRPPRPATRPADAGPMGESRRRTHADRPDDAPTDEIPKEVPMTTVALYARVSTDEQATKYGLASQLHEL